MFPIHFYQYQYYINIKINLLILGTTVWFWILVVARNTTCFKIWYFWSVWKIFFLLKQTKIHCSSLRYGSQLYMEILFILLMFSKKMFFQTDVSECFNKSRKGCRWLVLVQMTWVFATNTNFLIHIFCNLMVYIFIISNLVYFYLTAFIVLISKV